MKTFFDELFDFDHNGETNTFEKVVAPAALLGILEDDDDEDNEDDDFDGEDFDDDFEVD